MIQAIEELGPKAGGIGRIEVIDIPFDTFEGWYIDPGDQGWETIHENHRVWRMKDD